MKKTLTILLLLMTNLLAGKSICFEEQILEIGELVKYNRINMFQQYDLRFTIINKSFKSDTTYATNMNLLYQEVIQKIEESKLDCSDYPSRVVIKFRNTFKVDSIYYEDEELIINLNLLGVETYSFGKCFNNAIITNDTIESPRMKFSFEQKVETGNKVAFVYIYKQTNPFESYTKQEEGVFFQIPKGIDKFEFRDEELKFINLTYQNICSEGCGIKQIRKGVIKGYLKEDLWLIELEFENYKETFRFQFKT
jgi:hypothetical protein